MKPPTNEAHNALSRRDFFKSFVRVKIGARTKEPTLSKNPAAPRRFALNALKDLPEPALRQMVPVLRRDLAATIQDSAVAFRGEGVEGGLVPLRLEACEAVRLFDGCRTLEQIGSMLEIERAGKPGSGFLLAREAFLALSARGVYHPIGPPPEDKSPAPVDKATPLGAPEPGKRRAGVWRTIASAISGSDRGANAGLLLFAAVLYIPFMFLGYGADADSYDVLRTGRIFLSEHRYVPSRYPGHVVHEMPTAILDRLGGFPLANMGTVLMSLWALHSFMRILNRHNVPHRRLLTLVLITNPLYWAASTCTIDYVWAMALMLAGYVAYWERRRNLSGILFGLAIGCRAATILFVLALAVAHWLANGRGRRQALHTFAIAIAVGLAAYVPTLVRYGIHGLYVGEWGLADYVIRFLDGNMVFWGHLGVAVIACGFLLAGKNGWQFVRSQPKELILLCAFTIVGYEALYMRYPLEEEYMLPMLPFFAILAGFWLCRQRWAILLWLVFQASSGFITLTFVNTPTRLLAVKALLPALPGVAFASFNANEISMDIGLFSGWGHLLLDVVARMNDMRTW